MANSGYLTVEIEGNKNDFCRLENRTEDYRPGYSSYVIAVSENDNVCSVLEHISGLKSANLFATKKRAQEVADHWDECYKNNGSYLYAL